MTSCLCRNGGHICWGIKCGSLKCEVKSSRNRTVGILQWPEGTCQLAFIRKSFLSGRPLTSLAVEWARSAVLLHNKRHLTKCCHLKFGDCSYMEMFAVRKPSQKGRGVCDQRQKAPEPSGVFCQLHPNTGEAVPLKIVTLALTHDVRN